MPGELLEDDDELDDALLLEELLEELLLDGILGAPLEEELDAEGMEGMLAELL